MKSIKIPSREHDRLRDYILDSKGHKVEVIVYGRIDGHNISVCVDGYEISEITTKAIEEAVKGHFETQSRRGRVRTLFFLCAYHDVPRIFLGYSYSDNLMGLERETYEVPEQIMRVVRFLEEEPEAEVQFRVYPYDEKDRYVEFRLSRNVEMAGSNIIAQCSQKATQSFDFVWGVGGEYMERVMQREPPVSYGSFYVISFVLEEENGVIYFRMYHKGQRFFSVEKDKLRGEKS